MSKEWVLQPRLGEPRLCPVREGLCLSTSYGAMEVGSGQEDPYQALGEAGMSSPGSHPEGAPREPPQSPGTPLSQLGPGLNPALHPTRTAYSHLLDSVPSSQILPSASSPPALLSLGAAQEGAPWRPRGEPPHPYCSPGKTDLPEVTRPQPQLGPGPSPVPAAAVPTSWRLPHRSGHSACHNLGPMVGVPGAKGNRGEDWRPVT